MIFQKEIALKDGTPCQLRSGREEDAADFVTLYNLTHAETDFLLSYPDESRLTDEGERAFLSGVEDSSDSIEICAFVDGKLVGCASFSPVGRREKVRCRADFGISVLKAYWGRGVGRALTATVLDCARRAGYAQVELSVVADNASAIALYKSVGFVEYGRNPRGFRSRFTGWQELVLMRLELD